MTLVDGSGGESLVPLLLADGLGDDDILGGHLTRVLDLSQVGDRLAQQDLSCFDLGRRHRTFANCVFLQPQHQHGCLDLLTRAIIVPQMFTDRHHMNPFSPAKCDHVSREMRAEMSVIAKRMAEAKRCPDCRRKSALKTTFHSLWPGGSLAVEKCRWCDWKEYELLLPYDVYAYRPGPPEPVTD